MCKQIGKWFQAVALIICTAQLNGVVAQTVATEKKDEVVVFEPKAGEYSSTRIPALVLTKKGTLLAFAAGRIESASDWADMDLLLRRSEDGGNTWGAIQVVAERAGGKPTDNPAPIVGSDGTIHLLYQRDYAYAYYTQSTDDGLTWSPAVNITSTFDAFKKDYDWKVLAPAPGHGIQLKNGRLLVPVWLANSDKIKPHRSHHPSRIATIYSDDNGKTWRRGAMVPEADGFKDPSETMAVQLPDGRVMLSIRNESVKRRKGVSFSKNVISGWTTPTYDEALFEPICMSSMIAAPYHGKDYLLFLNPDSEHIPKHPRQNLTLKASDDSGKTWAIERVVNEGISGYSDITMGADGTVYCLFETKHNPKDNWSLVLKRVTMDELVGR
ncbi:sialidase family protein [Parapedobacter tibetensis]|nr:sialidase family protein [Parapedobacter tibetensis]